MKIAATLLFFAVLASAVEPNFVRTTVYKVGKNGTTDADLVTTEYSDGLGRQIQSKVKISDTKDQISCTFYDDIGRPETATKVFIDELRPGSYLPGTLIYLNASSGPLQTVYGDTKAYSYTKYSDGPLSRVIEQNGPGQQFVNNPVKMWYFGVSKETKTVGPDNISFIDGFIKSTMNGTDFDAKLNTLTEYILDYQVFTNPTYFLTVSKDALGNYTQELKNLFGKTEATRATVSGNEIIARYYYDILGNLLEEEAPDPGSSNAIGNSRYTYNTLGQVIKKVTPDGGAFGFAYTVTGQLASDTSYDDATKIIHRICRYTYDDLDRPVLTEVKNDNDLKNDNWTAVIRSYYDNIDELNVNAALYNIPQWILSSFENLSGRLAGTVAINIANGRTYYISDLFSYDDEGRIKCKLKIVPGIPYQTTSFCYDLHGKVLSDTVRCGSKEIIKNYVYDALGRLEKVVHANNNDKVLATYTYDELGRLDRKKLAIDNGRDITYGYTIREWVTSIAPPVNTNYPNIFKETIPESEYLANGNIGNAVYKYTYQGSGSPVEHDLTYAYDEVNRLTGVTTTNAKYIANYTYDVLGRFKTKKEGSDTLKTGYMYYTGTSRLKNTKNSGSDKDYIYDKNGNLVIDKIKKMVIEYDWRDMPVAFRFYSSIPSAIDATGSGEYSISSNEKNIYRYMASQGSGVTLLSQVVMLYDASGNRVIKMEGK